MHGVSRSTNRNRTTSKDSEEGVSTQSTFRRRRMYLCHLMWRRKCSYSSLRSLHLGKRICWSGGNVTKATYLTWQSWQDNFCSLVTSFFCVWASGNKAALFSDTSLCRGDGFPLQKQNTAFCDRSKKNCAIRFGIKATDSQ